MEPKRSILCVDDEAGILRSLERCLLLAGYEVLKAASGVVALEILDERRGHVDLIIVDQRMPQMGGDEVLRVVKERYGVIRSIMLSGHADVDSLMRAVNAGEIYSFVAKPWDNEELLGVIRSAVRARA